MTEILLSACGAWVLVNMIQIHLLLRIKRKPLNCHTCLSGWFCLGLCIPAGYVWYHVPFMMAAAMIVSGVMHKIMK